MAEIDSVDDVGFVGFVFQDGQLKAVTIVGGVTKSTDLGKLKGRKILSIEVGGEPLEEDYKNVVFQLGKKVVAVHRIPKVKT